MEFLEEEEDEDSDELKIGMEVLVLSGEGTTNKLGDVGIITEIDDSHPYIIVYRVCVEGGATSGNWMNQHQIIKNNL